MGMPCRHIFFVRKYLEFPEFEISMVADRWKRSYQILNDSAEVEVGKDEIDVEDSCNTEKGIFNEKRNEKRSIQFQKLSLTKPFLKGTLSQNQKYNKMLDTSKKLAVIASQCGMPEFREKFAQIERIVEFWNENVSFSIQKVCQNIAY